MHGGQAIGWRPYRTVCRAKPAIDADKPPSGPAALVGNTETPERAATILQDRAFVLGCEPRSIITIDFAPRVNFHGIMMGDS